MGLEIAAKGLPLIVGECYSREKVLLLTKRTT